MSFVLREKSRWSQSLWILFNARWCDLASRGLSFYAASVQVWFLWDSLVVETCPDLLRSKLVLFTTATCSIFQQVQLAHEKAQGVELQVLAGVLSISTEGFVFQGLLLLKVISMKDFSLSLSLPFQLFNVQHSPSFSSFHSFFLAFFLSFLVFFLGYIFIFFSTFFPECVVKGSRL